ncbi:MAG: hypothetical protein E5Y67_15275 [Mesorhizobium sp.]|uniref:hypothetical protein n=1 Tax=Mesorhizobium sp. TaxID=1871066 RepID=UPI0011FEA947|nr:hypothetical protein [Mesorhizobium sp.]TIM13840.1 MAG: hypothetical protein E5Y67_15275 [Mesorhizobium sp.]
MKYPGIKRAALEIAYDNGGINRMRSEKTMLGELARFLERQPEEILPAIDAWLSALSGDDLQTVCAGEQSEVEVLLRGAPPFTDSLLNDYFDEVC